MPSMSTQPHETTQNPFVFQQSNPSGPQKIKDDGDIFSDFDIVTQTPAINRYKIMGSSAPTETMTMNFQPMYEGNNDIRELFTDLAD